MDNPLELMYSWQAVAVAIACVGITKLVKTIIDAYLRSRAGVMLREAQAKELAAKEKASIEKKAAKLGYRDQAKPMKAKSEAHYYALLMRKNSVWMNRFVLPMTPIVVGMIVAMVIPIAPEGLIEYLDTHVPEAWGQLGVKALWGGACGQFADYIFSKVKAFFEDFKNRNAGDDDLEDDLPPGAEVVE